MMQMTLLSRSLLFLALLYVGQVVAKTERDSLRGYLSSQRSCFDVKRCDLALVFDTEFQEITGSNKIAFEFDGNSDSIQLDLFQNMVVDSVKGKNGLLQFRRYKDVFYLPTIDMHKGRNQITVFYHGVPIEAKNPPWEGGFVRKKDKKGRSFIGVACEGIGASLWWPCKDHYSDKIDTVSILASFSGSGEFVSNGNRIGLDDFDQKRIAGLRLAAQNNISTNDSVKFVYGYDNKFFKYLSSYPIVNYNVTFYIADFIDVRDKEASDESGFEVSHKVLDYSKRKAKKHFKQVGKMLTAYEELFGEYPFPNDGFRLVEAPYLGMEHQTAIAYGNKYKKGYLGRKNAGVDLDYVILHEMGHEYWGNSVTMEDYADMWIHESFCTYSEVLVVEKLKGKKVMKKYLLDQALTVQNDEAIIPERNVNAMGSIDMYAKGSVVLHQIREQLSNDSIWFASFKAFHQQFKYQSLNTQDCFDFFERYWGKGNVLFLKNYLEMPQLPRLVVKKTNTENEYQLYFEESLPEFTSKVKLNKSICVSNINERRVECKSEIFIDTRPTTLKTNKKLESFHFENPFNLIEINFLEDE